MQRSDPVEGRHGKRRSFLRWMAIGVIVVIAAVAIVLSQQGGGGGSLNAVAEAAERTEHEPGGHAAIHGIITSPDGKKIVMTGTMVVDDSGDVSGAVSFPNPKSGDLEKMRMVGADSAMYVRSNLFGSLPGGAKWMKIDAPALGSSAGPAPTSGDAEEGLKLLQTVDNVEKLGEENVRGVPATRYRGTTGSSDKPLHVEAWIDGEGRVVRMRILNSPSGHGAEASPRIDMRTTFFDFGPVSPIKVPDPSEVFDATALGES